MNVIDLYSPYLLRFAIEKELILNNDPKIASITALKRLKKDPEYYHKNYGYVELQKARNTKYLRKIPDGKGGYRYVYRESDNKNLKKIKLRMQFDIDDLFDLFKEYFVERIGNKITSNKALKKSKIFEEKVSLKNKEYSAIIDEKGKTILIKSGNNERIEFNDKEIKKIINSEIVTHTHLEDKSFSAEDVFFALSLGINEIRVKTPDNIYSFKINHKNKSSNYDELSFKNLFFLTVLKQKNDIIKTKLIYDVISNKITKEEAQKNHRIDLWNDIMNDNDLSVFFNIEFKEVI